jgi:acyl-CoA thioesterase
MGAALYYFTVDDEAYATSKIHIVYLNRVTSGTFICNSKVIHKGKQIAFLESEIINKGHTVAKAMGTYSIFKRKSE